MREGDDREVPVSKPCREGPGQVGSGPGRGPLPGAQAAFARFASAVRVTATNASIATSEIAPTPANAYQR